MSSGSGDEARETGESPAAGDRGTCTPCRGTGRLISALGGQTHEVSCPWCGGSGRFEPGHDAQQNPAERAQGGPAADPTGSGEPASAAAEPDSG